MPNTTNFNFPTPADTDLVKDGALAIRNLGNSIDTAFVDLKGGTTGQVLAKASNTDLDYSWVAQDDSNAIQNALLTTTGDTIYASGASTPARLGIGSTGQVLTVAGGVPSWATPATAGGMTSLASGSLSGTAVNLSSISGSYKSLVLFVNDIRVNVATRLYLRFNTDTGSNYGFNVQRSNTATNEFGNAESHIGIFAENNLPTTSGQTAFVLEIDNYTNTLGYKSYKMNGYNNGGATAANYEGGGVWKSTSAITAINFNTLSGTATFSGSYTLYGVN